MAGFFSGIRGTTDAEFDPHDAFVPEHIPGPGSFLDGHEVLTGRDHVAFNRLARQLFEHCGVYDMTFGYNLARLNLDRRHPEAGYRYAVEDCDGSVLRAEFTPTTEFCPQSDTLTVGSWRAFNGESDRHEFDLVRVRVERMHHQAADINDKLRELEDTFVESGTLRPAVTTDGEGDQTEPGQPGDVPF